MAASWIINFDFSFKILERLSMNWLFNGVFRILSHSDCEIQTKSFPFSNFSWITLITFPSRGFCKLSHPIKVLFFIHESLLARAYIARDEVPVKADGAKCEKVSRPQNFSKGACEPISPVGKVFVMGLAKFSPRLFIHEAKSKTVYGSCKQISWWLWRAFNYSAYGDWV